MVTLPNVNLNGTSRNELIEQQQRVMQACDALIEALLIARPHGRDYQGHPEEAAYRTAADQHRAVVTNVVSVKAYTMNMLNHLQPR